MRASRVSRFERGSTDGSVVAMRSSSLCRCTVLCVARVGTDSTVAVPVSTLVCPDILGVLSFDNDLFLKFFVESTELEI